MVSKNRSERLSFQIIHWPTVSGEWLMVSSEPFNARGSFHSPLTTHHSPVIREKNTLR
jgi:hypothetical protein